MNVNLEIRHLKLLAAVAEEGSITGASRRLHLTQSALSYQLRDAEQKLGTSLFLRLGKKMVLTPAGSKLLESALRILHELRNAESQIASENGQSGMIRVSTECYTCYQWLPAVLAAFHARFPQVDVNIDLDATADPVQDVLAGTLDVAIISCPPRNTTLRLTHLCQDEMLVVMATTHRLASQRHINAQDLAGETVLVYPPRDESTLLRKVLQPAGVEPGRVLEIPLTEAILEMVSAGMGITFLASWALGPGMQKKKIVARPLTRHSFQRDWFAAVLRDRPMPAYLGEFLNLLTDHFPVTNGARQLAPDLHDEALQY
jgi:LysR family transcriptional regulator for metE and metH